MQSHAESVWLTRLPDIWPCTLYTRLPLDDLSVFVFSLWAGFFFWLLALVLRFGPCHCAFTNKLLDMDASQSRYTMPHPQTASIVFRWTLPTVFLSLLRDLIRSHHIQKNLNLTVAFFTLDRKSYETVTKKNCIFVHSRIHFLSFSPFSPAACSSIFRKWSHTHFIHHEQVSTWAVN